MVEPGHRDMYRPVRFSLWIQCYNAGRHCYRLALREARAGEFEAAAGGLPFAQSFGQRLWTQVIDAVEDSGYLRFEWPLAQGSHGGHRSAARAQGEIESRSRLRPRTAPHMGLQPIRARDRLPVRPVEPNALYDNRNSLRRRRPAAQTRLQQRPVGDEIRLRAG